MDKRDYNYALVVNKFQNGLEYLANGIVHIPSKDLNKKLNIKYGEEKGQRYDLIYPQSKEKLPIMFYIHGEGFVSGTLALRRPYCYSLAKEGFFVVNIDYRLAPKTQFPEQFNDIFKVIEMIYDKAEEYNIDTSRVAVAGESAGGYFANYLGVLSKKKELFEKLNIKFKYIEEFDVKSTLLINGIYEIKNVSAIKALNCQTFIKSFYNLSREEFKKINEINNDLFSSCTYLDSTYPPSIVLRGNHDVYDDASKQITELFDEKKVEYSTYCTKGLSGLHGFVIAPINKEGKRAFKYTTENLKRYLGWLILKKSKKYLL